MKAERVQVAKQGGIMTLTLNRSEKKNAIEPKSGSAA